MIKSIIILSMLSLIHSWYPSECCSDKDCRPVSCEELLEQTDGSIKYGQSVFSKNKIKPSQDAKCHVCINPNMGPLCVYTLQAS